MIPADDIDQLLPSFSETRWRKIARIVGQTMGALEARRVQIDGSISDQFDARMAALVGSGQLEAKGNIKRWRHSEVRLPDGPGEVAE